MPLANEDWDTQMFYALEADWTEASLKVLMVLASAYANRWPDPTQLHVELRKFALLLHKKALIETGVFEPLDGEVH